MWSRINFVSELPISDGARNLPFSFYWNILWLIVSCTCLLMLPDTLTPYSLHTFFSFPEIFLVIFSSVFFLENTYSNQVGLSFLSFVWASRMFVFNTHLIFLYHLQCRLYFCYGNFSFFTSFKNLLHSLFFLNYSHFILVFSLHICLFHGFCQTQCLELNSVSCSNFF